MYPGLRVMEQEYQSFFLNRNRFLPAAQEMPQLHDWFEGQKVGYPENPFVRANNALFPWKIYDGKISPERQYLMDIGWDHRPIFSKGENGVEYTPEEQAALYERLGTDKVFFREVQKIMQRVPSKMYLETMQAQRETGEQIKSELWYDVYGDLNSAARAAKKLALDQLDPVMLRELRIREMQEGANIEAQKLGKAQPYSALTMTNN